MKALFSIMSLALCLAMASAAVLAQYPDRPVRLIVPLPAGGPSDTMARTLGQAMSKSIGQPIVIENRPGANGAIAAQAVLSAPPDGYTFLWGIASMVALPLLQKNPPFESLTDYMSVSIVGRFAFAMYVHPSVPAKSVAEFISYARANPDKLSYASSTLGEFMAAAQFMKAAGISMVRVPYKGCTQVMPDLIQGRVQVNFAPVSLGLAYLKDGRLRMLATLLPQRSASTPNVPTMVEAGMPGVSVPTWQAIFGPPRTPREIVDRVSREIRLALQTPEVRAKFDQQTFEMEGSTPQVLAASIKEDLRAWQLFIRENGITPE